VQRWGEFEKYTAILIKNIKNDGLLIAHPMDLCIRQMDIMDFYPTIQPLKSTTQLLPYNTFTAANLVLHSNFTHMKSGLLTLFLVISSYLLFAQNNKQTIRGTVVDKQSLATILGATLQLSGTSIGTRTNDKGIFVLSDIAPGRYELKVTYLGYKDIVLPNIVVTSGKETVLEIQMEENVRNLKDVVIKSSSKLKTNNELATISARSFSMEEVNRYAGGRSDPARSGL
jgi:hypothetical protein